MTLEVIKSYVSSRLETVEAIATNALLEDPLDDDESIMSELEIVGSVARTQYAEIAPYLVSIVDPLMGRYQELYANWNGSEMHVKQRNIIEGTSEGEVREGKYYMSYR